jgi:hypothetical protein
MKPDKGNQSTENREEQLLDKLSQESASETAARLQYAQPQRSGRLETFSEARDLQANRAAGTGIAYCANLTNLMSIVLLRVKLACNLQVMSKWLSGVGIKT